MTVPTGPDPDVLEFGGSGPDRPRPRWQRLAWLSLGLVAVLVGVFVVNAQHGRNVAAGPSPTPAASSRPPAAGPSPGAPPSPSSGAPSNVDLGHPWLATTGGWELVGRGPTGVVRIDPAGGHIVITPVPPIASSAPVSLVAGRGWILVKSLDFVPGYLVPDGQPARLLTGALAQGGPVLPGPDGTGVWTGVMDQPGGTMRLVGTDGQPLGPQIPLPEDAYGSVESDGTGYGIFNGVGGSWSARPDGIRRISTGRLLAAGPTRWLVEECDDQHRCSFALIDRSTGGRRPVPGMPLPLTGSLGAISPDGTRAAMFTGGYQPPALTVVDLRTGDTMDLPMQGATQPDPDTLAWSPDSAWLFIAGPDGTIHPYTFGTPKAVGTTGFGLDGVVLPRITQLTVRRTAPAG